MRKIIHVDMDAFFASIEQRDHSEYKGKPLVVGYPGDRGVIAAASYEARKYGIHSAMSSKIARKKYPNLIFAPPRFEVYKSVSNQIREIFLSYTDLVEPLSLDEAFLDVTENFIGQEIATEIAREIKERIFEKTALTASAGVSFNKFLAKIASDQNKPNGIFVITPQKADSFIRKLPIEKFFGIGKVTAEKMRMMGIFNGADLQKWPQQELVRIFGKTGLTYYQNSRGEDDRKVNPNRIRKSLGAESTFHVDLSEKKLLLVELRKVAEEVCERIEKSNFKGKTLTLKIKYADFKLISKSKTYFFDLKDFDTLWRESQFLLNEINLENEVRLIGLSVKNANEQDFVSIQLEIPFNDF